MRLLLAAFLAASLPVLAQSLAPGEYLREGGGGSVTLKGAGAGRLAFEISTVGANAHTCFLDGTLVDGVAKLEGVDDKPCTVRIRPTAGGIDVAAAGAEACNGFCGMRATLEGAYLMPAPECTYKAREKTRALFKRHYDAKRFAEAKSTLEPLFLKCAKLLDWLDEARIRNDLAITHHRLGEREACRLVLSPLAEDARKPDAKIREDYPPTDADSYLPVVRATRTNLKLCGAP